MSWISTRRGYVNSRYVKWVRDEAREGRSGKKRWVQVVEVDDEREAEVYGRVDTDNELFTVMPASVPMTLVEVCYDERDGQEEFWVDRHPIIGWRIREAGYPEPIAIGCHSVTEGATNCILVIEMLPPFTGYSEATYEGAHFATLEECKAHLKTVITERDAARQHRKVEEVEKANADG